MVISPENSSSDVSSLNFSGMLSVQSLKRGCKGEGFKYLRLETSMRKLLLLVSARLYVGVDGGVKT